MGGRESAGDWQRWGCPGVGSDFEIEPQGHHLIWSRKADQIAAEARLDGVCVVRTSLAVEDLGAHAAVAAH